jgi:hypothetical protein
LEVNRHKLDGYTKTSSLQGMIAFSMHNKSTRMHDFFDGTVASQTQKRRGLP